MDKYPKTGGEESIKRTSEECAEEEVKRLGHLTLIRSLPDNVFRLPKPHELPPLYD